MPEHTRPIQRRHLSAACLLATIALQSCGSEERVDFLQPPSGVGGGAASGATSGGLMTPANAGALSIVAG